MRRALPAFLFAGLLVFSGCVGVPTGGETDMPTPTLTPTERPSATTDSPSTATSSPSATQSSPVDNVTVEYVVQRGSVPDELESLNVSLEAVFVERAGEVDNCYYPEIFGQYEPTPTPLAQPEGTCIQRERTDDGDPLAVDLTAIDGNRTLGTVTGPAFPDGDRALLVVNATARHENGTRITEFYDETFIVNERAIGSSTAEPPRVVVQLGAKPADEDHARWAYELTVAGGRASSI